MGDLICFEYIHALCVVKKSLVCGSHVQLRMLVGSTVHIATRFNDLIDRHDAEDLLKV